MVTTHHNMRFKYRKLILLIGGLLIIGCFLLPHLAHAAPAAASSSSSGSMATELIQGLSKINKLLQVIFWPVLLMIGSLMQNDILFSPGAEGRLLEIWVNVRNIVNILFVLVLLGIAFYNVVGEAAENYHLKTIIPKFIFALIAVNFTFVGIKVVLDVVNVVSTAIFALPNSVENTLSNQKDDKNKIGMFTVDQINGMCGSMYAADPNDPTSDYRQNVTDASKKSGTTFCNPTADPETGSFLSPNAVPFFNNLNANNAAMAMAITLQKADLLDQVYGKEQKINIDTISVNMLFSIVLYVIFGTAYVALFVTMLVRVVMLWIMIAISPLMVLPYVLPEKLKSMLGEGDLVSKMMKTVMVPIPVSIVMSIGFVMLQGLEKANLSSGDGLLKTPTLSLDLLTSGLSTLQQLLVALGASAFIWVGVFTALKGTYADHIMEGIKSTVGGAAKGLTKFALGSVPIFPVGKGQMASGGALAYALNQIPSKAHEKFANEARDKFPDWMSHGGEAARRISEANNWGEVDKNMRKVAPSGAKQAASGVAAYVKKKPGDKKQVEKALAGRYSGTADEWLKKAEDGTISDDEARLLWQGLGMKMADEKNGKPDKDSIKDAGAEKARRGSFVKNLSEHRKNHSLDDVKMSDDELKQLATKAETDESAREKLNKIIDGVEEKEKKGSKGPIMEATVKNALAGPATAESFTAVENALQKTLEETSEGHPPRSKQYEESKSRTLKAARENGMTKEKHEALMAAAKKAEKKTDGTLFSEIYPEEKPAAAPASGTPKAAAPAKPAAPTAPAAPPTPPADPKTVAQNEAARWGAGAKVGEKRAASNKVELEWNGTSWA